MWKSAVAASQPPRLHGYQKVVVGHHWDGVFTERRPTNGRVAQRQSGGLINPWFRVQVPPRPPFRALTSIVQPETSASTKTGDATRRVATWGVGETGTHAALTRT